MKRILYLLFMLFSGAMAQSTTTPPSGALSFTPSFRYKAKTPDSLNDVWMYNALTGKYNQILTATQSKPINQFYLSKSGGFPAIDTALRTGSDNSVIINSLINTLTSKGGGVLYIDGMYMISHTVVLKSNVQINGLKSGLLMLKDSSNCHMITSVLTGDTLSNRNISLVDINMDGNAAHNAHGENGNPNRTYLNGYIMGCWFGSFDGLYIRNLYQHNVKTFGVTLSQGKHFFIQNLTMMHDNTSLGDNQDGLHMLGKLEDGYVNKVRSNGDDDILAFNTTEVSGSDPRRGTGGHIYNIEVDDAFFDNAANGVRIFGDHFTHNPDSVVDKITIRNVHGNLTRTFMSFDNVRAGSLSIDGWHLDSHSGLFGGFTQDLKVGRVKQLYVNNVDTNSRVLLNGNIIDYATGNYFQREVIQLYHGKNKAWIIGTNNLTNNPDYKIVNAQTGVPALKIDSATNRLTLVADIVATAFNSGSDAAHVVLGNGTLGAYGGGGSVTSVTSANSDIGVANTTTTPVLTLNNINGVTKTYYYPTSSIQTQLNAKQSAITLTTTGVNGASTFSAGTLNVPTYTLSGLGGVAASNNLSDLTSVSTARTNLGLVIGTNVLAQRAFGTAANNNTGDFEVPITFSTGLTRSTNTVTVNTAQNISTLSNLTSNGLITTSGGTGALSIIGTTGSGSVVLATSPVLVTPDLGTPSAIILTNATGTAAALNIGGSAGSVPAANITGATLASGVTASSLTSLGVLTGFTSTGIAIFGAPSTGLNGIIRAGGAGNQYISLRSGLTTNDAANEYYDGTNYAYTGLLNSTIATNHWGVYLNSGVRLDLSPTGILKSLGGFDANSNKMTNLSNGSANSDGANVGQLNQLLGYTVSTLPSATTGKIAYVTDALTPSFGVIIVGGGSTVTPVFYNGTNWIAY